MVNQERWEIRQNLGNYEVSKSSLNDGWDTKEAEYKPDNCGRFRVPFSSVA